MLDRYQSPLSACLVAVLLVTAGCSSAPASDTATSAPDATLSEMPDHLNVSQDLSTNHTYYAINDTIEYIEEYRVTVNSTTGEESKEPVYGTTDADTWLNHKGATVAAHAVRKSLATNASNQSLDGITVESRSEPEIQVAVVWTRNTVGNTEQTPSIPQSSLRRNLPERVTVTLTVNEKQVTNTYNVTVDERTKS